MTRRHWWQLWRPKRPKRLYATLDKTEGKRTVMEIGGCGGSDVRYTEYVSGEAAAQAVELAARYTKDNPPLQPDNRKGVKG